MKNTLKIVFLGIIGFALLVYLTAPEQNEINKSSKEFSIYSLPSHFEAVGNNLYVKREELLKDKDYFIVLNHDSLVLSNKLNDIKNIFLVANVSKTPWFMKKLAVNSKLDELAEGSNKVLVNDSSGDFISSINLHDEKQNSYFIYRIKENKIYLSKIGSVNIDALQKGISDEDIKTIVGNIKKSLNQ
jgi:hypothetical protein